MTNEILDGSFTSDYLPNLTAYQFDVTGINPSNLITNETTTPILNPAIFSQVGPFYTNGLSITGHKLLNPSVQIYLVLGTDYVFSPRFENLFELTGLDVYSFIILLDYTSWQSVTLNYQAVGGGVVDQPLLNEIVVKNFDTTLLSNWLSLVGDSGILASTKIEDLLKQSNYMLNVSNKLEIIAETLRSPLVYLQKDTNGYNDLVNQIQSITANFNALKATLTQSGLLSGNSLESPVKRCTVLSASGDSVSGTPYLTLNPDKTVSIDGSTTPIVLSMPDGYNSSGPVDHIVVITTLNAHAWDLSNVPPSSTAYLYVQLNIDGSLSYHISLTGTNYIDTSPLDPYPNLFNYVIKEGQWWYNGVAVSPLLFLGEASVDGSGNVVSIITYSLNGVYDQISNWPDVISSIVANHNLGVNGSLTAKIEVICITQENGYSVGDVVSNPLTYITTTGLPYPHSGWVDLSVWYNRLQAGSCTGNELSLGYHSKTTGSIVVGDITKWKYRLTIGRGF